MAASFPALAQTLDACEIGRHVIDGGGRAGVIAGGRDQLCLVKYSDGTSQSWVPSEGLRAGLSKTGGAAVAPSGAAAGASVNAQGVTVLRPEIINRLVFHADALGHIVVVGRANGAPVKFLVDTGATLVSLSAEDAGAAGLKRNNLTFDQVVYTGNGPAPAAFAQLRELRIEDLELDNVQVAVIETLKQSVLGMSFLRRLKEFDMQDGVLTLTW